MNRLELTNLVRERLGEQVESFWTNDFIHNGLNECGDYLTNLRPKWKCQQVSTTLALVANNNEIDFPADYRVGLEVEVDWDNTGDPEDRIAVYPCEHYERRYYEDISNEKNPSYYVWQGKLYLLPTPTASASNGLYLRYSSYYSAQSSLGVLKRKMTQDTDLPIFEDRFHMAYVYYALSLSREKQGEPDIDSEPWRKFRDFVSQMLSNENNIEKGRAKTFTNPRRLARKRVRIGMYR